MIQLEKKEGIMPWCKLRHYVVVNLQIHKSGSYPLFYFDFYSVDWSFVNWITHEIYGTKECVGWGWENKSVKFYNAKLNRGKSI